MIPIILGAVALGAAATGILKGVEGATSLLSAEEKAKRAEAKYKRVIKTFEAERDKTNEVAQGYGLLQFKIASTTVRRFVDFIERNGRKASQSEREFLEGFETSVQQVSQYKAMAVRAETALAGVIGAGIAAGAAYSGAMGLATSVGVASTGAAISGLSGAAATNATLAWLGGGALSAGGGGMALGSLVLSGITLGPALAVGGFVLAGQGEEALTKARKYEAEANLAIETVNAARAILQPIERRIHELAQLLNGLNRRAVASLDLLESGRFDPQTDAEQFQQVALLIKALVEVMKVPVLDEDGTLNADTTTVLAKYRHAYAGSETPSIQAIEVDAKADEITPCSKETLSVRTPMETDQQARDNFWALRDLERQIDRVSDSTSERYGKLLNWEVDGIWHYGIGLSDNAVFETGAQKTAVGCSDAKTVLGVDDLHYSPAQVIERLKLALKVFQDWQYNSLGWNSEHFARLVATGEARSYQSQPVWWISDLTPDGHHKTAEVKFTEHLIQLH